MSILSVVKKMFQKETVVVEENKQLAEQWRKEGDAEKDQTKAWEYYRKAAENGDDESQYQLACAYEHGNAVIGQDKEQAFHWYQQAALQGNRRAQNNFGMALLYGVGCKADGGKAKIWLEKAAAQNVSVAMFNLGYAYEKGEAGFGENMEKAVSWYRRAAEHEDVNACSRLADIYASGKLGNKDERQAAKWYQKAIKYGDHEARCELGCLLVSGEEPDIEAGRKWLEEAVQINHSQKAAWYLAMSYLRDSDPNMSVKAAAWLEKTIALEPEDSKKASVFKNDALTWLGICCARGEELAAKDVERARALLEEAAQNGYAKAQFVLGQYYHNGEYGLPKDQLKGLQYIKEAAEQGDADAQYMLGCIYEFGDGVEQNGETAWNWYVKSAKQMQKEACTRLAGFYWDGQGVKQDRQKAKELYGMAAVRGHAYAQAMLGFMYEAGELVDKDIKQAKYWLLKAAEQSFAPAWTHLGKITLDEGDTAKAFELFKSAARFGDAQGMEFLSKLYNDGLGVEKDEKKAQEWHKRAYEARYGTV